MPSEQMIQQTIQICATFSPQARENILTALLSAKLAREVEGVQVVMDPKFARMIQPILDDEAARDAMLEALMRMSKQDEQAKKKKGWRRFFGG